MKEELVSFELAKKLKEIGFNADTLYYYNSEELFYDDEDGYGIQFLNHNLEKRSISAPTYAQAQKWFYDNKGLFLEVMLNYEHYDSVSFSCGIYSVKKIGYHVPCIYDIGGFKKPEEALEAGLNKSCELIKP